MEGKKLTVDIPIVVEGKYDKITLSSLLNATVLTTDGFSLFKNAEKKALLKRLGEPKGLIILTDSDGGGMQIRSQLGGILPKEKLYHLYIPKIEGKEKRKKFPSKQGYLGVEGMEADLLRELFAPFATDAPKKEFPPVTSYHLYERGLLGGEGSARSREKLCGALGLPPLNGPALIAALNLLGGLPLLEEACKQET